MLLRLRVRHPDRSSTSVQLRAIISWPGPSAPASSTASCITSPPPLRLRLRHPYRLGTGRPEAAHAVTWRADWYNSQIIHAPVGDIVRGMTKQQTNVRLSPPRRLTVQSGLHVTRPAHQPPSKSTCPAATASRVGPAAPAQEPT